MNYKKIIKSMKCKTLEKAQEKFIPVFDKNKNQIGKLIPVGKWILNDKEKIEQIMMWRKKAMKMFLTQFESTYKRTFDYLNNLAINQEDRLLFLIYDDKNHLVGHIGVANVNNSIGELDNLIRGVSGGHPRLIYFSEIALLNWCFKELQLLQNILYVLSFNTLVVSLHLEVGYRITNNHFLERNEENDLIVYSKTKENNKNVNYKSIEMFLDKKDFYYRKNNND